MRRRRRFRGVSFGTVTMLLMTALVVAGMMAVLPKLTGNTHVKIDTGKVLDALSLGDNMPELLLSDIPIRQESNLPTVEPTQTALPSVQATPSPTPVPTAVPQAGGSFTLTAGGSIVMDATLRKAGYYSESEKYDYTDVFSLMKDEVHADLNLVTLENLVYPDAKLSDVNTAAEVMPMLSAMGMDTVALGFGEVYDHSAAGLNSTVQAAEKAGLRVIGAHDQADDALPDAQILTLGGVKVALLHFTDGLSSKGAKAIKKEGRAFAVPVDAVADGADALLKSIDAVQRAGAQVVIVSLNWGSSGKSAPTQKQKEFAQQLADAGVDVIIGAGSKVVQPVVWLDGKAQDGSAKKTLCAYSLGSLYNSSRKNGNVAGMLLHLNVACSSDMGISITATYTPTYIWRYKQDSRYYYRVVASDRESPDGMGDDQSDSRRRAYQTIKNNLGSDTAVTLR